MSPTTTVKHHKPKRVRKAPKPTPPMIPTTLLRTSERLSLNDCRYKHHWNYTDQLRPIIEKPELRFGTLIHKALEVARRNGKLSTAPNIFKREYDAELERTTREWPKWRDEDDEWHSYLELGVSMLHGYIEHFAESDKEYVTLATEQTFKFPIWTPPTAAAVLKPPAPNTYVGTFDRILIHLPTKRLLFGDYKTTKDDPTKTSHLALDEQAGSYWAYGPLWLAESAPKSLQLSIRRALHRLPSTLRKAAQDALNNGSFDGILYDFMRKAMPDDRPTNKLGQALNKDGRVSQKQPVPRFHREIAYRDQTDREAVLRRSYEDAKEIGQIRNGHLALKKSPSRFHCMLCPFTDMCELHETGADWEAYRDAMMTTWEPYADHEIEDAEHV